MKKIVLFGAFDRYNYGDNLMPILFQMYIEKYAKHVLDNFEFEYVSISASNLEKFSCYPTISINSVVDSLPAGSVVVVTGGEVLCARNQSLFLHMQSNTFHHLFLKVFKKLLPRAFNFYAKSRYSTLWEFPFIPSANFFAKDIHIIFNTVGGDTNNLTPNELADINDRIQNSSYFSVRDNRTLNNIQSIKNDITLAPDSAHIMSDLISKANLANKVGAIFLSKLPEKYYVFQAAPYKVGCSIADCISHISELANQKNIKIVLLPIGYASGHDDFTLLQKIHKALPNKTMLLDGLTLWEIMCVIASSEIYIGTSLHGTITAMSFNIPHFGINNKIAKLDAFLRDWSVAPYNRCYPLEDIAKLPSLISDTCILKLNAKTVTNIEQVKENYHSIVNVVEGIRFNN